MASETQGERLARTEGIVSQHSRRIDTIEKNMTRLEENAQLITRLDERSILTIDNQEKQSAKIDKLIFYMMTVGTGFIISVVAAAVIMKG